MHATARRLADPEIGALDDIVDLKRYPLDRPDSTAFADLVSAARAGLANDGAIDFDGFLRPEALGRIAAQITEASRHVPVHDVSTSVYVRDDLERDLPDDDPRRQATAWQAAYVTRDMLPAYGAAQRLYVSPAFKCFIAACVAEDRVFEYADPLAGLVANVLSPGGLTPWHYDTNEYVVTIMIQPAEGGGRFEYHHDLRRPGDENLDGLAEALAGTGSAPRSVSHPAGTLQLFRGRYSLHRVSPVEGARPRQVLVLSYSDRPGVIGPLDRTRKVYGRVTEAHLLAHEADQGAADGLIL
ncbi:MAG: hypothetical protein AAGD35_23095 [Actinomycetota bacterium]